MAIKSCVCCGKDTYRKDGVCHDCNVVTSYSAEAVRNKRRRNSGPVCWAPPNSRGRLLPEDENDIVGGRDLEIDDEVTDVMKELMS